MMEEGVVPASFKESIVSPIHKEGKDARRPDGWRPINLLQALTQIWEKSVLYALYEFLDIDPFQHAYQSGKG